MRETAPHAATSVRLGADQTILPATLATTPVTFLHGDWKIGNRPLHRRSGLTAVVDADGQMCIELALEIRQDLLTTGRRRHLLEEAPLRIRCRASVAFR